MQINSNREQYFQKLIKFLIFNCLHLFTIDLNSFQITLALLLPVTIAIVERVFSTMNLNGR